MAYGIDETVYVEDNAGDLGGPPVTPAMPWWLSPDVQIPAHPGTAFQGPNDVQIRVHTHDEPYIDDKIVAEVYVGNPSLVMSPTANTKRIDPGNLLFRPPGVAGTEPVADVPGATLTFAWTPSGAAGTVDGPGHHCLVVRAFPSQLTPPTDPFDVPLERHEAQHNLEILTTTHAFAPGGSGFGLGTPHDPRRRDKATGLWWEELGTVAAKKPGRHFVVVAYDPKPGDAVTHDARDHKRFSEGPPDKVVIDGRHVKPIDPGELTQNGPFTEQSGLGTGIYEASRLVGAAELDLESRRETKVRIGFDHSNLAPHTAVALHAVQFDEHGNPEGGMTIVALAPR